MHRPNTQEGVGVQTVDQNVQTSNNKLSRNSQQHAVRSQEVKRCCTRTACHSFENFGVVFCMTDIMAFGMSSDCSSAELKACVYRKPSSTLFVDEWSIEVSISAAD